MPSFLSAPPVRNGSAAGIDRAAPLSWHNSEGPPTFPAAFEWRPVLAHTGAGGSGMEGSGMATQRTAAPRGAETLALGFGTSVAMWFVGYLCRMPPAVVPSWLLALLLLACLVGGGFVAGRLGARGWRSGLAAGLLSSVVNLLVLGSLLGGGRANQLAPSALWWIPGSLLLGAAMASAGAAVGVATRAGRARRGELDRGACRRCRVGDLAAAARGRSGHRRRGRAFPSWTGRIRSGTTCFSTRSRG